MDAEEPYTMIISVRKTGHVNQCKALCGQLGWKIDDTVLISSPSRSQPLWGQLLAKANNAIQFNRNRPKDRTAPKLRIVASGKGVEKLASCYRRLYRGDLFSIFIGAPQIQQETFDVAVVSRHAVKNGTVESRDFFKGARHAAWMTGVPIRAFPASEEMNASVTSTVLVGGINKGYELIPRDLGKKILKIRQSMGEEQPLNVVFSRRTPKSLEDRIRSALSGESVNLVDRNDRDGFLRSVQAASRFFVTPDSITMICEASATGRPVTLLDCPIKNIDTSTVRFVESFVTCGYVRKFEHQDLGTIRFNGLEDVAADVSRLYEDWK